MSFKSFFDRSFFINLLTMPLKGGTWEKLVSQGKELGNKDKGLKKSSHRSVRKDVDKKM